MDKLETSNFGLGLGTSTMTDEIEKFLVELKCLLMKMNIDS